MSDEKELLFPPNEVVYEYEGERMCSEELALAQLLADDVLLPFQLKDSRGAPTTALFVNTSDDFAWACADCEPLPNDEIPNLYSMHVADRTWGALRWACLRRNQQATGTAQESNDRGGFVGRHVRGATRKRVRQGVQRAESGL
jgi:hypothetical protein